MRYTNIRYSTMLNDAQLDYLSDECQDINRMMCFKTFLRMALMEPTKVSKKHFSADLQPGQFEASKVELAMMWRCNRKTATRIIREFNLMGILSSEPSNRTTIHTLRCLSVWFTDQRMVKNSFFVSHPVVKPIEKQTRTAAHVPPVASPKSDETDKSVSPDSGETSAVNPASDDGKAIHATSGNIDGNTMSPDTQPAVEKEQHAVPSFSLLSDDGTPKGADDSSLSDGGEEDNTSLIADGNSQSSSFDRADNSDVREGAAVDRDKPELSQTSLDDGRALPEFSTGGK